MPTKRSTEQAEIVWREITRGNPKLILKGEPVELLAGALDEAFQEGIEAARAEQKLSWLRHKG